MTATVFNCFYKLIVQITSPQNEKTACGSLAVGAFVRCAGGCGSNPQLRNVRGARYGNILKKNHSTRSNL